MKLKKVKYLILQLKNFKEVSTIFSQSGYKVSYKNVPQPENPIQIPIDVLELNTGNNRLSKVSVYDNGVSYNYNYNTTMHPNLRKKDNTLQSINCNIYEKKCECTFYDNSQINSIFPAQLEIRSPMRAATKTG